LFLLGGLYPRNNLHAFWDAIVGFNAPWTGSGGEAAYVGGIAGRLETRYRPSWARTRLLPGEFQAWSREGVRMAQQRAYPAWLVRGQPAPQRYNDVVWTEAQRQLALAGYRLADVLNRALGGS
ncbi:MAG TPA: S1/P1 nuclease, partial [Longimicrobium sp.]|nr:S1/P1 nuclease [Longimicrobium sp.]